MTAARHVASLHALAASIALFPFLHVVVVSVQNALQPEPDPAIVLWTTHSQPLAALMVSGFVWASCAFGTVGLARARPLRFDRWTYLFAAASALAVLARCAVFS